MIKPPSSPPDNLKKEIAALDRMSVGQLRVRHVDVFGEPARSGNRQWLVRRVAWRLLDAAGLSGAHVCRPDG